MEGLYRIGAGEKQPLESGGRIRLGRFDGETLERGIEREEVGGVHCLDGWDEDGFGTERAKMVGELRGLLRRAGDEDARLVLHGALRSTVNKMRRQVAARVVAGAGAAPLSSGS